MGEISGDFILESRGRRSRSGRGRVEVGARSVEVGSEVVGSIGLDMATWLPTGVSNLTPRVGFDVSATSFLVPPTSASPEFTLLGEFAAVTWLRFG